MAGICFIIRVRSNHDQALLITGERVMNPYCSESTEVSDALLCVIAHMPTLSLPVLLNDQLSQGISDHHLCGFYVDCGLAGAKKL